MDFVAMTENKRGHLRIPEARLVSKMNTGFKHFTHGCRHKDTPKV
jgi:hypothetical protein